VPGVFLRGQLAHAQSRAVITAGYHYLRPSRAQPIGSLSPAPVLNRSRMLQAGAVTVH